MYMAKEYHLGQLFLLLSSLHPSVSQSIPCAPFRLHSYDTDWPSLLGVASSPDQGASLPASIQDFLFSQ